MEYTMERYKGDKYFGGQYSELYDFLLCAADRGYNEHFHWGRFEWMMGHPMLEADQLDRIGIFRDSASNIAGLVTYDTQVCDHTYLIHSSEDKELLDQMIRFTYENYKEKGSCIVKVNASDHCLNEALLAHGFMRGQTEDCVLEIPLSEIGGYSIPEEYKISPQEFIVDGWNYSVVIHKGFNHEGLPERRQNAEYEKAPHEISALKVFALKEGEYCAHCGVWYTKGETAYVEPVVTIPECRNQGLARAVVYEALMRAKALGATRGVVLSTQEFYYKIGFRKSSEFVRWEKGSL